MNTRVRKSLGHAPLPSVDAGLDGGGGLPASQQPPATQQGAWGAGVQSPAGTGGIQQIPVPTTVQTLRDPVTGQFTKEATDLMEHTRREVQQQLHSRLERMDTMDSELTELRQERADRLAREAQEAQALADQQEAARVAELTAVQRVTEIQEQANARIQALQDDLARRDALADREAEYQALQGYRARRLGEEGALIAPQFQDFVQGNSEEEIERSIVLVRAKTEDIVNMFSGQQQYDRQQMRGVSPTAPALVGPLDSTSGQTTITAEEIDRMDNATYAANRQELMAAARRSGPYGRQR